MKLIVVIVSDEDANDLMNNLLKNQFSVTKLASTGGFLKSGNTTLLIGIDDSKVDSVVNLIENSCQTRKEMITTSTILGENPVMGMPIEITVGGATVFVIDVEKHLKI